MPGRIKLKSRKHNAKTRNRTSDSDADVEQNSGDAPFRAEEAERFTTPVRLVFTHYRKRLVDLDNLSIKAVLDAIVRAGVLRSDSPQEVTEISHRQIKSEVERTVVLIEGVT